METQIIFDGKNKPIGKLVTSGNITRAYDQLGHLKGYYDSKTDRTMNERNALFSKGNRVSALIR